MNIDISKYPVRRSNPIIHGSYGLPTDTERYIVKGQGLIGIDLDKGDNLYFKNLELSLWILLAGIVGLFVGFITRKLDKKE